MIFWEIGYSIFEDGVFSYVVLYTRTLSCQIELFTKKIASNSIYFLRTSVRICLVALYVTAIVKQQVVQPSFVFLYVCGFVC